MAPAVVSLTCAFGEKATRQEFVIVHCSFVFLVQECDATMLSKGSIARNKK